MKLCSCRAPLRLDIEVDSGICGECRRRTEHLVVSQDEGSVTPAKVVSPVVSQEPRQVVSHGEDKGFQETKQQRWRRAHADQRREIHRDGQRRRRGA